MVSQSKVLPFTFIPARKCFLGYTVLKRYVLRTAMHGKTVVIYLATVV